MRIWEPNINGVFGFLVVCLSERDLKGNWFLCFPLRERSVLILPSFS